MWQWKLHENKSGPIFFFPLTSLVSPGNQSTLRGKKGSESFLCLPMELMAEVLLSPKAVQKMASLHDINALFLSFHQILETRDLLPVFSGLAREMEETVAWDNGREHSPKNHCQDMGVLKAVSGAGKILSFNLTPKQGITSGLISGLIELVLQKLENTTLEAEQLNTGKCCLNCGMG